MYLSRRSVLVKLSALMACGSAYPSAMNAASDLGNLNIRTFHGFIEVLLPEDGISPSGSSVGVADDLLKLSRDNELYSKLIALGCSWLDSTGTGSFSELSEADQITVVQWMTTSDYNQIPRRFYHLTRQAAMELYFSGEHATNGLPLNSAPQPDGYMPPWA